MQRKPYTRYSREFKLAPFARRRWTKPKAQVARALGFGSAICEIGDFRSERKRAHRCCPTYTE
jgi:hypothetical protein